ncbi:alanine racemase [Nitratireductor kimnyeongensis]|uniref:Alanine racemase n=1 Tax=Nitratireductor kimnyeongensis TaxID=430679 RepID=A0ABW0T3D8_9HYPH|nr:alanine racemase [Nitratireductor kimnyeongensis]QZZ35104.1 alanine racemase [Nitratireductor kimnyeongensis]
MTHTDPQLHGVDPRVAGGRLTVDLDALAANYRFLAEQSTPAEAGAVVKADAYGLGTGPVVEALVAEGCRKFFVALPEEGLAVRASAPEADIYVFNGLFSPEAAAFYREGRLLPVLNSQSDLSIWEAHGWDDEDAPRPCALHVETGMNRLGLTPERAKIVAQENALTGALTPRLIISHLACADTPDHPMNRQQLESFQALGALFPDAESSLANSAGIFLGGEFLCDVTRPGVALYGSNPMNGTVNPMQSVASVHARIAQLRHVPAGATVSYGATPVGRDTLIAVTAVGYADGYHRSGSGAGVPLRTAQPVGSHGYIEGRRVPVLGRVTMDLTLFDVTDLGLDTLQVGDFIELMGSNLPMDELASACGTISYELLTSLGHRFERHYVRSGDHI